MNQAIIDKKLYLNHLEPFNPVKIKTKPEHRKIKTLYEIGKCVYQSSLKFLSGNENYP